MKMKKTNQALALLIFFITPITSNAAIVYSDCYYDSITNMDVCTTSTETLNFDITGTSDFYNFDYFTGQDSLANSSYDVSGSLQLVTITSDPNNLGNFTTTTSGDFTIGITDITGISYSAQFSQDAYTGMTLITSESLSGIAWNIETPTLWSFNQTLNGGMSLNTIPNDILGNYPGFNPLDGILTGSSGVTAVDMTLTGTISAVPVPAAVWLFGSGIISLVGFASRKKK